MLHSSASSFVLDRKVRFIRGQNEAKFYAPKKACMALETRVEIPSWVKEGGGREGGPLSPINYQEEEGGGTDESKWKRPW